MLYLNTLLHKGYCGIKSSTPCKLASEYKEELNKYIKIDLNAIKYNYRAIAALAKNSECAPVVKSNAYGTGMIAATQALEEEGAKKFFVSSLDEAICLRENFPSIEILCLDWFSDKALKCMDRLRITPTINSFSQAKMLESYAKNVQKKISCIACIETGLYKFGISENDMAALAVDQSFKQSTSISLIFTHLAASYIDVEFNKFQIKKFDDICKKWPSAKKSVAASGGIYLGDEYLYDLVRPGRALYGVPRLDSAVPIKETTKNVASLYAKIMHIHHIKKGESVGYDRTFIADRDSRIAVVGIGYADGLPYSMSNCGLAFINGVRCKFAGLISMNASTIDVTDANCNKKDWIEFIGDNISLAEAAKAIKTTPWELLTNVGSRIQHLYT
ncbi:alanine racemase [Candidatus Hydrogenosomobacter endosymbioticus]|uniref:Alanine racemase n=1 Tax=Candidatus Hydrogenosomobacter endosymbioticus TaxID=2558174 RepID=A0ABN6L381_9PROT|nr:alanine racemase [Candidatus Hydrogenosomobacter endosymbioticus]BDB96403.1 alanine racemase, catabolic [Candidatus Hydrogenosomobacter endosymbioticus]